MSDHADTIIQKQYRKGFLSMREYVRPMMENERFAPNEYIAVCWQIACAVGAQGEENQANREPRPFPNIPGVTHSHNSDGTGCGWAHSQFIRENVDGSFSVVELGDNDLDASLGRSWSNLSSTISDVKQGETIYWTTTLGDRTWHHYGTVGQVDPNRPNHS